VPRSMPMILPMVCGSPGVSGIPAGRGESVSSADLASPGERACTCAVATRDGRQDNHRGPRVNASGHSAARDLSQRPAPSVPQSSGPRPNQPPSVHPNGEKPLEHGASRGVLAGTWSDPAAARTGGVDRTGSAANLATLASIPGP
jgi:hypothetical protein